MSRRGAVAALMIVAIVGACHHPAPPPTTTTATHGATTHGMASWYGEPQMTASGERFDKHAMTAAHRSLPFNTRVRVTNTKNGRSVVVRINDRGPHSAGRIIDLSEAAAKQLDMIDAGVAPVTLEVVPR